MTDMFEFLCDEPSVLSDSEITQLKRILRISEERYYPGGEPMWTGEEQKQSEMYLIHWANGIRAASRTLDALLRGELYPQITDNLEIVFHPYDTWLGEIQDCWENVRTAIRLRAKDRYAILVRDNHTCQSCFATGVPLHVDHIIPVARGGSNDPVNLQTLCAECNQGKGIS